MGDRLERLAVTSARIPFRLKVALVWVVIFAFLGFFFWIAKFDTGWMQDNFTFIAKGLQYTLYIALGGIAIAVVLALLGALARISSNPIAYGISGFYISFFRGTPLLLQIYLIYQGLAQQLNLVLGAITAGIIALSLNYGAYLAEINRAGIESIPKGQREAAIALGLRPMVIMWKIILPQAMRVIIPPTFSQFIAMLKDTSLVSALGVWELLFLARSYGRADFRYIEMLLSAAALYWILSILLELLQVRIERYYGKGFAGEKTGTAPVHIPPGHH
jgi:polar amino acid transport system permease protein